METFEYPLEWYEFVSSQFTLRTVALGQRSTFRPDTRTSRLITQFYQAQFTQRPRVGPTQWQGKGAFFARLDGDVNLLRIGDPLRCQPAYTRARLRAGFPQAEPWDDGTWWANGKTTGWVDSELPEYGEAYESADRGSRYLKIRGFGVSTPGLLAAGDVFEIRPAGQWATVSCFHEIVVGGGSDADGVCGVEIRPRLRLNVLAGDMIVFRHARALMRLTDADQGAIFREGGSGSFGFSCAEHTG